MNVLENMREAFAFLREASMFDILKLAAMLACGFGIGSLLLAYPQFVLIPIVFAIVGHFLWTKVTVPWVDKKRKAMGLDILEAYKQKWSKSDGDAK